MKHVLAVFLFLILSSSVEKKDPTGCLEIDIILVGDLSGSVEHFENFVADAFDAFVDRFDLSEGGVRIGTIIFNDGAFVLSELTTDKTKLKEATDFIRNYRAQGSTNMAMALVASEQTFAKRKRNARKMVVMVSDGSPTAGGLYVEDTSIPERQALIAKESLSEEGIEVCGVLITSTDMDPEFMMMLCDGGCYVETNYQMLAEELLRLDVCF